MRYEVLVTRDTTQSVVVAVEAVTRKEAAARALVAANRLSERDWEVDDAAGRPYVAGEESVTRRDDRP